MPQENWKALQKKILEKAEKGDNQHRGKKNNQDLETTRRSYATRRLKMLSLKPWALEHFSKSKDQGYWQQNNSFFPFFELLFWLIRYS